MRLRILRELADAVAFVHGKRVAHRDLKPANILLDTEDHVKLADFGCAKVKRTVQSLLDTPAGTPLYQAPELLREEPGYGLAADIYSLALVFYQTPTGLSPYPESIGHNALVLNVGSKGERPKWPDHLARDLSLRPVRDLIEQMWRADPKQRPDASAVLRRLQQHHSGAGPIENVVRRVRWTWLFIALVIAAALIAVVVVAQVKLTGPPPFPTPSIISTPTPPPPPPPSPLPRPQPPQPQPERHRRSRPSQ